MIGTFGFNGSHDIFITRSTSEAGLLPRFRRAMLLRLGRQPGPGTDMRLGISSPGIRNRKIVIRFSVNLRRNLEFLKIPRNWTYKDVSGPFSLMSFKSSLRDVSFRPKGPSLSKKRIERRGRRARAGVWRMSPHLLALVVVLGLILGDAAASLTNSAQAHIQFRWASESASPAPSSRAG